MSKLSEIIDEFTSLYIYSDSVNNRIQKRMKELKKKIENLCEHDNERINSSGPRDNGEVTYKCKKCNVIS